MLCYACIVMQQSHTPFMEKTCYFILSGYFLANGGQIEIIGLAWPWSGAPAIPFAAKHEGATAAIRRGTGAGKYLSSWKPRETIEGWQQYDILMSHNYIYAHFFGIRTCSYIYIHRQCRYIYIYNVHVYLWLVACGIYVYLGSSNAQNAQRQMLHIVHGKWRWFSSQLSHNSFEKMQLTHNPVNVRY